MLSHDALKSSVEEARHRGEGLREWARSRPLDAETSGALSTALDEVDVVGEELQQQVDELAGAHDVLEAERRRYRDLFDFAPDGQLLTEPSGVICEANRAAGRLLGMAAERLVGKPFLVFVAVADRRAFLSLLDEETDDSRGSARDLHIKPRGREAFLARIGAARSPCGASAPGRRIAIGEVAERHMLERRLARQAVTCRLGAAAEAVADHMRQPLAGMQAALDVLARRLRPGDDTVAVLGEMTEQVRRLDAMAAQLLTLARTAPRERTPVRLRGLLEQTAARVRSEPGLEELTVEVGGADPTVAIEPDGVADAVRELLRNAGRAIVEDAGRNGNGAKVRAHVRVVPGRARIEIRDFGPGVHEADRGRILEPFFTTHPDAVGLGLALAARSLASQGGRLTIRHPAEGGVLSVIELPLNGKRLPGTADGA